MARLIGIIGDIGCGKTALMTLLLYDAQQSGLPIIANYSLAFPNLPVKFGEIVKLTDDQLRDAWIGTDELNVGADSYEFFTKQSTQLSRLTTQLRKTNNTWIFTTTRFRLIALRIRQQTGAFMFPTDNDLDIVDHKKLDANRHPVNCAGQFRVKVYDGDLRYLRSFSFDATQIWNLYNSNETIRA